jgi:hypothetical protein
MLDDTGFENITHTVKPTSQITKNRGKVGAGIRKVNVVSSFGAMQLGKNQK